MFRCSIFFSSVLGILLGIDADASDSSILIPVPNSSVRLETFVYEPTGAGKYPVVIFNHGSAGGNPRLSVPSQQIASYFVQQGFMVLVPMRRGRGKSTGVSPESEDKNCDPASWKPGLRVSFDDVSAVFKYLARIPGADSSRVIIAGASRGGFLSVAYAAAGKYRKNIIGVINFVGGWVAQAEDNCPIDFNYVSFAEFGAKTRAPMLWLYGSNDAFYAPESIENYQKIFSAKGGNARFELIDGVPENGHWLPAYPDLWTKPVDSFLSSLRSNIR